MKTLTTIPALWVALACGDGGPTDIDYANLSLAIIVGNAQADTVTKRLPDALMVRVTESGEPRAGVLVNFVVVEEGCGSAFAPAVLTNASGDASNVWTLGTLAGPCSLEARAINDLGEAVTFDTFRATAMPAVLVSGFPEGIRYLGSGNLDMDGSAGRRGMRDVHGNQVYWHLEVDEFAHVLSADETIPESRIVVADSIGSTLLRVVYNDQVICRPTLSVFQDGTSGLSLTISIPSEGNGGCTGTP